MKTPPEDIAQKLLEASDQFVGAGFDVSIDEVAQASGIRACHPLLLLLRQGRPALILHQRQAGAGRDGDCQSRSLRRQRA